MQIEDVEFQTITTVRIYARYVPVIFLSFFYVIVYCSRHLSSLKSFSHGRSGVKSSPEQFPTPEAKAVCIAAGVPIDEAWISLFFSPS